MPADGLGFDQVFIDCSLGKISTSASHPTGHVKEMIRLQPRLVRAKYLTGEIPYRAATFINRFMVAKGDFPSDEFRSMWWIHSSEKQW